MKKSLLLLFLIIIQAVYTGQALAQQRIITVPNAEYLDKGVIYTRFVSIFKPYGDDKFVSLRPEVIYGAGHQTELFAGVIVDPTGEANTRLDFAAKKVFLLTKDQNTRFTTIYRIQPDLEDAQTPFNIGYAHLTQYIPKTRSRLTAGMYITNGIRPHNSFLPDKPGVVLGFEEVLIPKKLIFSMDWTSRNENVGVMGIGLKYSPTSNDVIIPGVLIPNGKRAKFAFIVFYGHYFR